MNDEQNQAQNWQSIVLVVQGFLLLALCGVLVWTTIVGEQNKQAICNAQNVGLSVMTSILTSAQIKTDTNPKISAASKKASDEFVVAMLQKIAQARC